MNKKAEQEGYDDTFETNTGTSYNFKIALVILLFFMTLFRLGICFYFTVNNIISDEVLLFVMLFITWYLWIRELKDRNHLLSLHQQLKRDQINTIAALIKTVEAKDEYTSGHSARVTAVATSIARSMKLSEKKVNIILRSALLHDIGKIGLSDAILLKKEKLSDIEWEVIRTHPLKAMLILGPLKFLKVEKDIILHHHERFDGKGYPSGLKGEEIPLGAAIITIADTFDAMNSTRSYRGTLNKDVVISELKKGAGKQFSPAIIEIFLKVLEDNPSIWGN